MCAGKQFWALNLVRSHNSYYLLYYTTLLRHTHYLSCLLLLIVCLLCTQYHPYLTFFQLFCHRGFSVLHWEWKFLTVPEIYSCHCEMLRNCLNDACITLKSILKEPLKRCRNEEKTLPIRENSMVALQCLHFSQSHGKIWHNNNRFLIRKCTKSVK